MQKVPENTGLDSMDEVFEESSEQEIAKTHSGSGRRFMEPSGSISPAGVLVEEGPKLPYQVYLDERAEFDKLFRQ